MSSLVMIDDYDSNIDYLPDFLEEIRIDQTPKSGVWKLTQMVREGANGRNYYWQIGFDGDTLLTLYGQLDSMALDKREVDIKGKNDIQEQALIRAKRKYENKFKKGYVPCGSTEPPMVTAMKGQAYKEGVIKNSPFIASAKMDGVRLLVQYMGNNNIQCKTYTNSIYKHLIDIEEDCKNLFPFLPSFATLDGEMYCHDMNHQEIISAVKTFKHKHKELHRIVFHVFDIFFETNPPSEERYEIIKNAYEAAQLSGVTFKNLVVVDQQLVYNHQEAVNLKNQYVEQGYEGLVLKRTSINIEEGSKDYERSRYHFGRKTTMYKFKDFKDEEAKIIRVEPAKGKEKGLALFVLEDKTGVVFRIRHGTQKDRLRWMEDPNLVIGKQFTFKYYERSPKGVPIQPTGVGFRDYE